MAEQNVVKMGESGDAKVASPRRASDVVSVTLRIAVERLAGIDRDPILREAIVRMGVRDFANALREHFPEQHDAVPEYFMAVAADASSADLDQKSGAAQARPAGGSADAEHRKSSGKAGG